MPYVAPVKDMLFVMNELAGLADVVSYPSYAEAGADVDLAPAILEEAAKFNQDVVAPLNWPGDQNPSALRDGQVYTTPGFKEAFEQFASAGWQGVVHPPEFGGQGLPKLLSTACFEMVNSANMSFALCPMLTDGAIEALLTAASPELQEIADTIGDSLDTRVSIQGSIKKGTIVIEFAGAQDLQRIAKAINA